MTRPVFGVDLDPAVIEAHATRTKSGSLKRNPLLAVYGPGPEGAKCGSCSHLFRRGGTAGRYYKCDLRRVSSSVVTDHRVRWPACGQYEEAHR